AVWEQRAADTASRMGFSSQWHVWQQQALSGNCAQGLCLNSPSKFFWRFRWRPPVRRSCLPAKAPHGDPPPGRPPGDDLGSKGISGLSARVWGNQKRKGLDLWPLLSRATKAGWRAWLCDMAGVLSLALPKLGGW